MIWKNGIFSANGQSTVSGREVLSTVTDTKSKRTAQRLVKTYHKSYAKDSNSNLIAPAGLTYLPYQKAGIDYMIDTKKCLLADDQGLGKTIQICGLINNTDVKNILIICPSSLKRNWIKELCKWFVMDDARDSYFFDRIEGHKRDDIAVRAKINITVINYDILGWHKNYLKACNFDLVVIDEVQFLKNPETARTKSTIYICKGIDRVVALSGTPMLNRPIDLYPMLSGIFKRYLPKRYQNITRFGKHFCAGYLETIRKYDPKKKRTIMKKVWNFRGSSNLKELNSLLRERFMIRRIKKDVLPQLPDKRTTIVDLSMPAKLRKTLELVNAFDLKMLNAIETGNRMPPLEGISSARKELALEKIKPSIEFIETILGNDEQVIVFCHHTEVALKIKEILENYGVSMITGATPNKKRDEDVELFQSGKNRVFIGNIQAAGTGLTLTAASNVVFVECSWVPGENLQAQDRAHRIGQLRGVNIYYLVWFGSMDAQILKTSFRKQVNIDKVMR